MPIKTYCIGLLVAITSRFVSIRGDCDALPNVHHSRNNATHGGPFPENYVIEFRCSPFYKGWGNDTFTCKDGSWVGKYHCFRVCDEIEPPENGYVVGEPLCFAGSNINFQCNEGCKMEGPSSLKCRADGKWRPHHPPTCKLINCGEFGSVTNGHVSLIYHSGHRNAFGTKLKIRCRESYKLDGSSIATCNANGQWSSKPICRSFSSCGRHPGAKSKCTKDAEHSGSMVKLSCHTQTENRSVTIVRPLKDYCMGSQWYREDIGCYCNCRVPIETVGVKVHGLSHSRFIKHGDELEWDCEEGYRKKPNAKCVCNDGEIATPICEKVGEDHEKVDRGQTVDCPLSNGGEGVRNDDQKEMVKRSANSRCKSGHGKENAGTTESPKNVTESNIGVLGTKSTETGIMVVITSITIVAIVAIVSIVAIKKYDVLRRFGDRKHVQEKGSHESESWLPGKCQQEEIHSTIDEKKTLPKELDQEADIVSFGC